MAKQCSYIEELEPGEVQGERFLRKFTTASQLCNVHASMVSNDSQGLRVHEERQCLLIRVVNSCQGMDPEAGRASLIPSRVSSPVGEHACKPVRVDPVL